MKKIFFPLAFILASCSDMVSSETAVTDELPEGFSVDKYVEINPDVKFSQIAIDIRVKNGSPGSRGLPACKNFLSDAELFEDIYLNYLNCPKEGWNPEKSCDGQSAFSLGVNNAAYNTANSCKIAGCWPAGWETPYCPEYEHTYECEADADAGLVDLYCCGAGGDIKPLKDNKSKVQDASFRTIVVPTDYPQTNYTQVNNVFASMCTFSLIPAANEIYDVSKVKAYLEDFWENKYDTLIVAKHFLLAGRYEGRAYRYCDNDIDEVRSQAMAKYIPSGGSNYFWDYSIDIKTSKPQFFCLNKSDGKVYRIK
jgi:hypothetical protein